MKLLIAEDDATSRKLLKLMIQDLSDYKIIGEATDGEELIELIVNEKPDIALVDIGLPYLNGMEAIKSCKEILPSLQVIFITGQEGYAVEAFKINAIDYIVKPINRKRLMEALDRVKTGSPNGIETIKKKNLMIKQQNSFLFIPLKEIIFIERVERKTVIHTKTEIYELNDALSSLERLLDHRFITSHRSNIINMDMIDKIEAVGQMYKSYFINYNKTAKIAKHKLAEIQKYKSQ